MSVNYEGTENGVRGAGAFSIRCGELARSRESDWLSLVKILIPFGQSGFVIGRAGPPACRGEDPTPMDL